MLRTFLIKEREEKAERNVDISKCHHIIIAAARLRIVFSLFSIINGSHAFICLLFFELFAVFNSQYSKERSSVQCIFEDEDAFSSRH